MVTFISAKLNGINYRYIKLAIRVAEVKSGWMLKGDFRNKRTHTHKLSSLLNPSHLSGQLCLYRIWNLFPWINMDVQCWAISPLSITNPITTKQRHSFSHNHFAPHFLSVSLFLSFILSPELDLVPIVLIACASCYQTACHFQEMKIKRRFRVDSSKGQNMLSHLHCHVLVCVGIFMKCHCLHSTAYWKSTQAKSVHLVAILGRQPLSVKATTTQVQLLSACIWE